jgi:hypothetical protein
MLDTSRLFRPVGQKELELIPTVGGSLHQEYWIPAEDLSEFNRNIVGKIEVIAEFRPGE